MAKIRSFGTAITVATNAVGGLTEINNGGTEANIIEVTNHGSADNSKEFIGGLKDGGEVSLSGFYDYSDVGQAYIRNNIGGSATCVLTYSSGSKITFTGIIKSAGEGAPLDDAVPFSATIKVSGKATYATP